ncbi:Very-short-patch-repair endonuclease [Parelusimicrobium proximum]|uniref:endonuclease domain-containing protein n=1 Tax=Parelusimicrobium proximum TaxID=3228953 RepID=UPI003D17F2BB
MNNKNLARKLRKNMTEQEVFLWSKIRKKQLNGIRFLRQKAIGPYIVDFCCLRPKIIIELDGGGHFTDQAVCKDKEREKFLAEKGFKVLRFTNKEVMNNIEGVLNTIFLNI